MENPRVVMAPSAPSDYTPDPQSDGDDERDGERGDGGDGDGDLGGGGDATMDGFASNAFEHDSEPESGGRASSPPEAHNPRCVNRI